ncbi:hypothetical protein RJ640_029973 [Escallonia rubra]|uniref:Uncharacterized protein n=1 Tax=Escallonia rubra TaxID=112253 RepID=A0AA88UJP4_9ASTE|nr:hypothetical protein RJ640_029973 [Escallonia rubra]
MVLSNVNRGPEHEPLNWPVKVIAANSMYRISQTLLLQHQDNHQSNEELFEKLSVMIADILFACLTNLPGVITRKCFCNAIEKREESVKLAARLLGETEAILNTLQQRELPTLDPNQSFAPYDRRRSLMVDSPCHTDGAAIKIIYFTIEMYGCQELRCFKRQMVLTKLYQSY